MKDKENNNDTVAKIVREMLKVAAFHTAGDQVSDSLAEIPIDDYAERIEVAHDREIKALEWKIENFAKVVECKDREIKAKDAKIEELREKWGEALNIADSVEKCASIEYLTEAMLKKNEVIAGLRKQIAELRDCLRIIRDNLLSYTIKSEDGKYVNNGGFLSEEFVDDERWRKALEGSDNEVE